MKDYLVSILIALFLCNELAWGNFDPFGNYSNSKFSTFQEKWVFEQNMSSCYTEIPMLCKVRKTDELTHFKRSIAGFFEGWIWAPYTVSPVGVLNMQGGGKFEIKLPVINYRQWLRTKVQKIGTILPDNFPLACICHVIAQSSYIKDSQYEIPGDNDECINECLYNCMQQY